MTSPSMVHRSGDTLVVRSVVSGNQLFTSDNEADQFETAEDIDYCDEFFDPDDNKNLPECKIRRNYSCVNCHYFTQNPRHYLYHLRDVHKEKVKIYECSNCLYASKHFQKLLRHVKMVHASTDAVDIVESQHRQKARRKRKRPSAETVISSELESTETEEMIDGAEDDEQSSFNGNELTTDESIASKPASDLKCSLCSFTTKHQGQLTRHEKQEHIKTKFFRCSKCSYVTHIKARFTKHVKYHSMPMIKCDLCDFRTPYKWNLDRHYKNHNGHGAFRCSACNFTADIKQSLTVHEMNHHVPPVGQAAGLGVGRRRNKVGASDTTAAEEAAAAAAQTSLVSGDTLPTMPSGLVISAQTRDFLQPTEKQETANSETSHKNPKIKISLKKFKSVTTQEQNERHNFETDFIHPDDIIHHSNGNIYIKNKCKFCNFKTAWDSEMAKHERKVHNIIRDNVPAVNMPVVKKTPRPIPNLIPIQNSMPQQQQQQQQHHHQQSTTTSTLKIPMLQTRTPVPYGGHLIAKSDDYQSSSENVFSQKDLNEIYAKSANSALRDFASLFGEDMFAAMNSDKTINTSSTTTTTATTITPILTNALDKSHTSSSSSSTSSSSSSAISKSITQFEKKNASFFDRLKEKLMTGESCNLTCKWCGHVSKCLSESAGHQKSCGKQQMPSNTSSSNSALMNMTSSTRCQYCRQRCKSSIDLHNHLQVCTEANKQLLNNNNNNINDTLLSSSSSLLFKYDDEKPDITIKLEEPSVNQDDSLGPHPMENVVFVWNNISPQPPLDVDVERADSRMDDAHSIDLTMRVRTPESENSSYLENDNNTLSGNANVTPTKMPTHGNDIDQVTDGRRVFKCPHCSFWATTASRFHVHIVGHLNKKPFECSLCSYRSNWRWDITKHIRLKSVRDPEHENARVLMTDETGRRNYSKYNKYLTQLRSNDSLSQDSNSAARKAKSQHQTQYDTNQAKGTENNGNGSVMELPKLTRAPVNNDFQTLSHDDLRRSPPPLKSANGLYFQGYNTDQKKRRASSDSKKTLFKCKKCNFRDASRENILLHVKGHYRQENNIGGAGGGSGSGGVINSVAGNAETDEASVSRGQAPFRCGHCHQVSNWKHVIQRHCRLKHSGDVRVVIGGKNGITEKIEIEDQADEPDHMDVLQSGVFKCNICPYSVDSNVDFDNHLEMHVSKSDATVKCYFCPYFVTQKFELFDHLKLHGVVNPEEYINRSMQGRDLTSPTAPDNQTYKRYKCVACPYVSNSKSQFLYHKQFHRHRGAPFKCEYCSYNVTRRHLLHQHLKVHGVHLPTQKSSGYKNGSDRESDAIDDSEEFGAEEFEEMVMSPPPSSSDMLFGNHNHNQQMDETQQYLLDVPLVWVSKDGKFSKMYKCRFCPHVNMRKVNIQEHEKMHTLRERNPNSPRTVDEHHCTECSYVCNNAGVLSAHLKVHQNIHGQIHCLVDTSKSDEEQISELSRLLKVAQRNNCEITDAMSDIKMEELTDHERETMLLNGDFNHELMDDDSGGGDEVNVITNHNNNNTSSERLLYFCQHCPARFLSQKEFNIHIRFHGFRMYYRCDYCSYSARQKPHVLAHNKVHGDEYQSKTKVYLSEYPVSKDYPRPKTMMTFDDSNAPVWIVLSSSSDKLDDAQRMIVDQNENNMELLPAKEILTPLPPPPPPSGRNSNRAFGCRKCPARFFKSDALKYHMTLHGCVNPYKCKYCDYAARTSSNLQKHHRIHEQEPLQVPVSVKNNPSQIKHVPSTSVPLSGTDLFQQKAEAERQSNNNNNSNSSNPSQNQITNVNNQLHIDPQFGTLVNGNPKFVYPTYLKNGRMKEKRYKCHKCPSAFEKRDQYKLHLSLHGSKQRYKCENCDYSVKYYANYVQHIRKHQVNDGAQVQQTSSEKQKQQQQQQQQHPSEDDCSDVSFNKLAIKSLHSSSQAKNGPLKLSVADRQTLMFLQKRRASSASSGKETNADEKKLFWCPHCPYTSYRKDAVDNHVNRHICVSGVQSNYTCEHCDYTVPQTHFLREHTKIHFTPQKNHQPEGFMICSNMELSASSSPSTASDEQEECVIFKDCGEMKSNEERFLPMVETEMVDATNNNNNNDVKKCYVNPDTGEFIENQSATGTDNVSVKSDTKEHKKSL